jgi:hypothetical protein
MKTTKILTLIAAVGALALAQSAYGEPILLGEQTIAFKLKLTTLKLPTVKKGTSSVSVTLPNYVGTITSKDVLKMLNCPATAKLVVRLYANTDSEIPSVYPHFLIKNNGAYTDVTQILQGIVPYMDPLGLLFQTFAEAGSGNAGGVISGKAKASYSGIFSASLHASLSGMAYFTDLHADFEDIMVGAFPLGNISLNGSALSKATASLNGGIFSGVTMNLSTSSQLVGGAAIMDATRLFSASVPAVVEGTVTTKGICHIGAGDALSLIDWSYLMDLIPSGE